MILYRMILIWKNSTGKQKSYDRDPLPNATVCYTITTFQIMLRLTPNKNLTQNIYVINVNAKEEGILSVGFWEK